MKVSHGLGVTYLLMLHHKLKFCTDKEETPFLQHRIKTQEDTKDHNISGVKQDTGTLSRISHSTVYQSVIHIHTTVLGFI